MRSVLTGEACQLKREATLPMTVISNHYTVPISIDGHTYPMIVDSGAQRTTLDPDIADALHLEKDMDHASAMGGVGGTIGSEYPRIIRSLKFGSSEWVDLRVPVAPSGAAAAQAQTLAPAGILGANVLSRYDVELDFPARTMSLYTATGCMGRFVPWQGDYQAYSADRASGNRFLLHVALNGRPFRAFVDTGADATLVTTAAADLAGVDNVALAHDPRSTGSGFGGVQIPTFRQRFSMTIGTLNYPNVLLTVANAKFRGAAMLLGMDYMRSRRVWLSYSSGWVFMQNTGGAPEAPGVVIGNHPPLKRIFHLPVASLSNN